MKKKLISGPRKILADRENKEHNFPIARNSSLDMTSLSHLSEHMEDSM